MLQQRRDVSLLSLVLAAASSIRHSQTRSREMGHAVKHWPSIHSRRVLVDPVYKRGIDRRRMLWLLLELVVCCVVVVDAVVSRRSTRRPLDHEGAVTRPLKSRTASVRGWPASTLQVRIFSPWLNRPTNGRRCWLAYRNMLKLNFCCCPHATLFGSVSERV